MSFSHKAVAGKSYVKYYAQCFELSTALKTFQIYQNRRLTVQPHKYFILHSYYMNYFAHDFLKFQGPFLFKCRTSLLQRSLSMAPFGETMKQSSIKR